MIPTLHQDPCSGNCYKIRLAAALLRQPLALRDYDILAGETRTLAFLDTINPDGRVPVLQVGDQSLPESNAACWWLAEGSALVPQDRWERAAMLRWMFWEQSAHEPTLATLRFWLRFLSEDRLNAAQRAQIPVKRAGGEAALALMERHLATSEWFAGDRASLADIVLYPYTSVAEQAGFALADHPHLCAWLERMARLPDYAPWGAGERPASPPGG